MKKIINYLYVYTAFIKFGEFIFCLDTVRFGLEGKRQKTGGTI